MEKRNRKMMNIKEILEGSQLGQIMRRSLFLADLNRHIARLLPPQYQGLYRVANLHEDSLSIEVKSAVVRQGFLFKQHELLALIQQDYPKVKQLSLRINPQLNTD